MLFVKTHYELRFFIPSNLFFNNRIRNNILLSKSGLLVFELDIICSVKNNSSDLLSFLNLIKSIIK